MQVPGQDGRKPEGYAYKQNGQVRSRARHDLAHWPCERQTVALNIVELRGYREGCPGEEARELDRSEKRFPRVRTPITTNTQKWYRLAVVGDGGRVCSPAKAFRARPLSTV